MSAAATLAAPRLVRAQAGTPPTSSPTTWPGEREGRAVQTFTIIDKPSAPVQPCKRIAGAGHDDDRFVEQPAHHEIGLPVLQRRRQALLRSVEYPDHGIEIAIMQNPPCGRNEAWQADQLRLLDALLLIDQAVRQYVEPQYAVVFAVKQGRDAGPIPGCGAIAEAERRIRSLEAENATLRGSTSWQVTAPLRALGRLTRRHRPAARAGSGDTDNA